MVHDEYIDVETDTSHNNRPQAGIEAATQLFIPLVEINTTSMLTVALYTKNKFCGKNFKQKCNHESKCKKNFSSEDSISSSEA